MPQTTAKGTTISGTDADAIHDNVDAEISLITEKASPVGADLIVIEDSAASNAKKKAQLTNLPAGSEANDLTAAVTWANVPDANVTESSVTQHEAALRITLTKLEVYNDSGAQIDPGDIVYISGYSVGQGLPTVSLADADNSNTMPAIGMVDAAIANLASGYVTAQGVVTGINTAGEAVGDPLYVATTPGTWTTTRPTVDAIQKIGLILQVSASGTVMLIGAGRSNDVPIAPSFTDYTNANHTHADAANGGTITAASVSDFDTEVGNQTDVAANTAARHAESHTVASHSDTTATGAELETLTDGSNADSLHVHEGTAIVSTGEAGASKFLREDGDGTCSWQAVPGGGDLLSTNNLSDVANAGTSRTNLGVAIGTNVQAWSAVLDATTASFLTADETKLDGIETAADVTDATNVAAAGAPIITSGAGAPVSTPAAVGDIYVDTTGDDVYAAAGTASSADWKQATGAGGGDLLAANNLSDVASALTSRSNLGLAIGTNVQAWSAILDATTASFLTADETKLDGIEALADVTDTTNVTAAGALMDSEVDADIKTLALPANTTISAFGATVVDDADAPAARTTLGVDAAGTDNSTDVTLVGTPDYITITGQAITRNQVVLTTDVSGTLPVANGGTGVTTSTGTTNVVLSGSPTIVTPTIASMTNAQHNHQDAAGGGTLTHNSATDNPTTAHGATGAVMGTTNTQTVTNKDLTDQTNKLHFSKGVTFETPVNGDRLVIAMNERAWTITGVSFCGEGGTSVLFNVEYATTVASGTVIHTDTATISTPEWDVTPSGTTAVPTNQIICVEVTTVTGTVNQLHVTIEGDHT